MKQNLWFKTSKHLLKKELKLTKKILVKEGNNTRNQCVMGVQLVIILGESTSYTRLGRIVSNSLASNKDQNVFQFEKGHIV